MICENEDGTFKSSRITNNLAIRGTNAGIKHYSLTMTPAYNAIPKFLAQTKYQNPTDKTPFNLAYNTDMPVFEWRKHNPENAKAGQAFMAAQRMGQRSVWDGKVSMKDFKFSILYFSATSSTRVRRCDASCMSSSMVVVLEGNLA